MQPVDTVEGLPKVDVNISLAELTFEKKISKGGFGEVWKASYLGTDVAVKRMLRPDDAFVMRLIQRELSALKYVSTPPQLPFTFSIAPSTCLLGPIKSTPKFGTTFLATVTSKCHGLFHD